LHEEWRNKEEKEEFLRGAKWKWNKIRKYEEEVKRKETVKY
jgi:hypothetical protein